MTEVGHKDETVRDQGLITSLALDVTLSSTLFLCTNGILDSVYKCICTLL